MSDPHAKAERSRAKDIRQGKIEQRGAPLRARRQKVAKPYHVRTTWMSDNKAWTVHRCATLEHAKQMMEKMMRTHYTTGDVWIELNGEIIDGVQLLSNKSV